jgi:hypothetical protein
LSDDEGRDRFRYRAKNRSTGEKCSARLKM